MTNNPSSLPWKLADKLGLTNSAKFRKAVRQDRERDPEPYKLAESILVDFHSEGGLAGLGEMQPYKLVCLQRLLLEIKPKVVLELGTGSSSVVFGEYSKQHDVKIVGVEESDQWAENTRAMLVKRGCDSSVELVVSPKEINEEEGTARYTQVPDIEADLVLVDGPALVKDGQSYKHAACIDVLALTSPKEILVDIRHATVKHLERVLGESYVVSVSDILQRRPRSSFNYFSRLTRRDLP